MLSRLEADLHRFSLQDSSIANVFDKRYRVLASLLSSIVISTC